jgi:hypothetical protein
MHSELVLSTLDAELACLVAWVTRAKILPECVKNHYRARLPGSGQESGRLPVTQCDDGINGHCLSCRNPASQHRGEDQYSGGDSQGDWIGRRHVVVSVLVQADPLFYFFMAAGSLRISSSPNLMAFGSHSEVRRVGRLPSHVMKHYR